MVTLIVNLKCQSSRRTYQARAAIVILHLHCDRRLEPPHRLQKVARLSAWVFGIGVKQEGAWNAPFRNTDGNTFIRRNVVPILSKKNLSISRVAIK